MSSGKITSSIVELCLVVIHEFHCETMSSGKTTRSTVELCLVEQNMSSIVELCLMKKP